MPGGGGGMDVQGWWNSVPPVTKWLFAGSMFLTLATSFGVIPIRSVVFTGFGDAVLRMQFWRLLTCLLVHKLGFSFLIQMLFLVRHSQQLEENEYLGRTADYLYFFILVVPCLLVAAHFLDLFVLGSTLITTIIYLWSRKYPDVNMTYMLGLQFKSIYFPWVLLAFHVLMGGRPLPDLIGIVVGHAYWFANDVVPRTHGWKPTQTPEWLRRAMPYTGTAGIRGVNGAWAPNRGGGVVQQRQGRDQGAGPLPRNWGAGHVLGND